MPPSRVKESCRPCRLRKTRCDSGQPCSSCTLRGTSDHCIVAVGEYSTPDRRVRRRFSASASPGAPIRRTLPDRQTPSSAKSRAVLEIAQLKASVRTLELHVGSLLDDNGSQTVSYISEKPINGDERANWNQLLAIIPSWTSCEILLDYLLAECDWLWYPGYDVVELWRDCISCSASSPSATGLLAISLAMPTLFLGSEAAHPLYRPRGVNLELDYNLYRLAERFIPSKVETMLDLIFVLAMMMYSIYSGKSMQNMSGMTRIAVEGMRTMYLWDESLPVWATFTEEERDLRRRLISSLVVTCRWQLLSGEPDILAGQYINVARPSFRNLPPASLVDLGAKDSITIKSAVYRVHRIKSSHEMARGVRSHQLHAELAEIIPQFREYLDEAKSGRDFTSLPKHCMKIYRLLARFRDEQMPAAGFNTPKTDEVDFTDPLACREVAQDLVLQYAVGTITALLLRPWLTWDASNVEAGSDNLNEIAELQQACISNAQRSMDTVGSVWALITARSGPIVTPYATSNLFNAAITFVIPVLRAVKQSSTGDREAEIRSLPEWPEEIFKDGPRSFVPRPPHVVSHPDPFQSTPLVLSSMIYTDPMVRQCANNALHILDALSILKASPLGASAERNLSVLVQKYGLRESYERHATMPVPVEIPVEFTAWPNLEAEPPVDQGLFDQLMRIDPSIWDGLLQSFDQHS